MPPTRTLPDTHTDFVFTLDPGVVVAGLGILFLIALAVFLSRRIRNR
jgi:hypothetical protein